MKQLKFPNALVCVVFVMVADWFFYRQPVGWTLGAFVFLLAVAVLVKSPQVFCERSVRWITFLLSGLVLAMVWHASKLAVLLAVLGVVSLRIIARRGWTSSAWLWLERWKNFAALGWTQWLNDLRLSRKWIERGMKRGNQFPSPVGWAKRWGIPVFLSVAFVGLFGLANPVIGVWLTHLTQWVKGLIADIWVDFWRLGLWALVAVWTWALLRPPLHKRREFLRSREAQASEKAMGRAEKDSPHHAGDTYEQIRILEEWLSPATIVRSLLLFNGLFAVQTVLDVSYLFAGAELPPGMTYSSYAHRGAYPLVCTALLAAVFVLVTFRSGGEPERRVTARRLVYLWLLQNVFLTFTAVWRLGLYVDQFSLTRLRVTAGIWMFLVAAGLFWICWRILHRRSNSWLVNVNVLTLVFVLYLSAFVDFDGWIAWYNVTHSREIRGEGQSIDLDYLRILGEEALPAVRFLSERSSGMLPDKRRKLADLQWDLSSELQEHLNSWRGWTFTRGYLASGYPGAHEKLLGQPERPLGRPEKPLGQIPLTWLGDDRLGIQLGKQGPITVTFWEEDQQVYAEVAEFNLSGFGKDYSDALRDLQQAIVELYFRLETQQDRLDPDSQRVWAKLREKLVDNRGAVWVETRDAKSGAVKRGVRLNTPTSAWERHIGAGVEAHQQGRYAEAERSLQAGLKKAETFAPLDGRLASSLHWLAAHYEDQGKYAEAEPFYKRLLAFMERARGPAHPDVAHRLDALAKNHHAQGQYAEAERLHKRALAIRKKALGPEHPDVASSFNNLGMLYHAQGRYADAERFFRRALAIVEQALGSEHPQMATGLERYADLLRKTNRDAEATELETRAKAIRAKYAKK